MTVFRLDVAELSPPRVDADGFLHVDAIATRAGVFEYRDESGVRGELRPPEEVFSETAMASLRGCPVTVGHVEMLNPQNVRALRVGVVEGEPRRDGALLAVCLRLDEPSVIDQVMAGTLRELSLGYRCDVELKTGYHEGKRYDMIQRNHQANHVALLAPGKARAGSVASIRLDAAEEEKPEDKPEDKPEEEKKDEAKADEPEDKPEEEKKDECKPDEEKKDEESESEVEVDTEALDMSVVVAELRDRVVALESLLAAAVTRADAAEAVAGTFRRQKLEADVSAVLPEERLDGVSDADLQARVISAFLPQVRLDGTSEDFRAGVFTAALDIGKAASTKQIAGAAAHVVDPIAQARAERDARNAAAWRASKA